MHLFERCGKHWSRMCYQQYSIGSYGNLCDQTNVCVCPNGAAATVPACSSNGATLCTSCNLGYQNEFCQVCQDGYAYISTTDTTCVVKQCTCAHGQASFNTTCPTHGQEDCVSWPIGYSGVQCDACIQGYHKEGNDCIVNECTCAHGQYTTNTSCATHNTESCASCDTGYSGAQCDVCVAGYHKDGTECKVNQCTCARPWGSYYEYRMCREQRGIMCFVRCWLRWCDMRRLRVYSY